MRPRKFQAIYGATWLELAGKWQRLPEGAASRGEQAQQQQPRAELSIPLVSTV